MKHNSKEMRKALLWKGKKRYFSKRYRPARAKKLLIGLSLKPGDIIHTCFGFNQVIKEILPEANTWTHQDVRNLFDFDITTEDGSSHSWMHCCGPKTSKEEIEDHWFSEFKNPPTDPNERTWGSFESEMSERQRNFYHWVKKMYETGQPICDDVGLFLPEYKKIMGYE